MTRYWMAPLLITAMISASMIYSMATIEKPKVIAGRAVFIDGRIISDIRFEATDAEDKHQLIVMKTKPGTEATFKFAVHINDEKQNIIVNIGEFDQARYCTGNGELTCSIPAPREGLERGDSIGIASFMTSGALMEVKEGRSDWDAHRALFSIR
jgi:hypothetical protein